MTTHCTFLHRPGEPERSRRSSGRAFASTFPPFFLFFLKKKNSVLPSRSTEAGSSVRINNRVHLALRVQDLRRLNPFPSDTFTLRLVVFFFLKRGVLQKFYRRVRSQHPTSTRVPLLMTCIIFFGFFRFRPSRKEVRTCSKATSGAGITASSGYRDKVRSFNCF